MVDVTFYLTCDLVYSWDRLSYGRTIPVTIQNYTPTT